jgi:RNA polymerase sigma-70 factor (ECF subfamily)
LSESTVPSGRADVLKALANELRPELHRYCARLTGSVFDGEDVVQDVFERALASIERSEHVPALRPWLFRIAHNRAIDFLRSRMVRDADPIDAIVLDRPDDEGPGPDEALMRQQAVETAVSRFVELPTMQRSVIILKDVLDQSLADIAALLDLTTDAVKAHLARGRARLKAIRSNDPRQTPQRPFSAATLRYAQLFNAGDWDGLRSLLANDVRLQQSTHAPRNGAADVGLFFTIYSQLDGTRLVPTWIEGREALAVFLDPKSERPDYVMLVEWRDDRISFIRDYRYVRYLMEGAGFELG